MTLGFPILRRAASGVLVAFTGALLLSCGGYSAPSSGGGSNLKFRAFISQNTAATIASPGVIVFNAQLDRFAATAPISAGPSPGLMAVADNHQITLVFNLSDNELNVVSNVQQSSLGRVVLPGPTESIAISPDASVGFAAVPTAPVAGQPPGAVEMVNLATISLEAPIPIPSAHFIARSPDGTRLLAFSDNINQVTVISLTNTGTAGNPRWIVSSVTPVVGSASQLDEPVWATFSTDGKTAFILNCGAECGGTAASVTVLNLANDTLGSTVVLPGGASYGVSFGSTLYVAGTAPGTTCPSGTAATSCGTLSVISTNTTSGPATLQLQKSVSITDGFHNRMAVTADNQVFVGALGCTNVFTSAEQRGCLSIYNSNNGKVTIGGDQGDVTGIQPVTGRTQVYVIENGELRIWSTLTDALIPISQQVDITGQAVDVKLAD